MFKTLHRRPSWDLTTASKIRYFETLGAATLFIEGLRKRGPVQARIQERTREGRWREIQIPEVDS